MRKLGRAILILGAILSAVPRLEAQVMNSLYFMPGVPQSNRVNPAHQPQGGFYLGLPGLAPLRAEVSSSSLALGDVILKHPTEDSLITFLHPLADKEAFLNKLQPDNYVISEVGSSLVSLGFRTGAGFFSLDISTRVDGDLHIPGDLAHLALEGTEEGRTYHLDGIGANLSGFEEVSLGWSYDLGDRIQIGARGKLLFGIGNLTTSESQLAVTTSEAAWNIRSNMLFKASLGFAEVVYDEEGMIEDIIVDEKLQDLNAYELARYAFNKNNMGAALDLGVNYRPGDRWLLSASLLDLGWIKWKDNVHEGNYELDYDYTSVEVNPFDLIDDANVDTFADSVLTALGDTLLSGLDLSPGQAYSTRLNTKLYLGASFYVTPNINFGLLSRTDFLRNAVVEQVTASANFSAGRILGFTLSYSYINSYFKNLGAGISLNAGPFNLYVVSDNALNAVFWPQEAVSTNLWFGMNLVFGYRQKMDRPLVY
jgi:outer membrane protein W